MEHGMASAASGLVVVANRLPYAVRPAPGGVELTRSVGGLVAAVEPVVLATGGVWIGWGGRAAMPGEAPVSLAVPQEAPRYRIHEVLLTAAEYRGYYHGFSNSCLWPLSHLFVGRAVVRAEHWEAYRAVNRRFARTALSYLTPGRLVWVHDYHLTLVPALLREARPDVRVAFFWHIPFPPTEALLVLPWAREVLRGLLGSDAIGFHTQDYARNFLRAAAAVPGAEVDEEEGAVLYEGRVVRVRALPVGVDWEAFQGTARRPAVQRRAEAIRAAAGTPHLVLGVDRLDYTKGIPERLAAFGAFLDAYPEYRDKVTFLQIGVPSRSEVPEYQEVRRRVEEAVGRVNGLHGDGWRVPVRYQARSLSREELVAHYLAADVALVTPLRDGLNLVAKEYVASRVDGGGALVLSPFAGAAAQLPEAVLANPYEPNELAAGIFRALAMDPAERARRMQALRRRVREHDLRWWWEQVRSLVEPGESGAAPLHVAG